MQANGELCDQIVQYVYNVTDVKWKDWICLLSASAKKLWIEIIGSMTENKSPHTSASAKKLWIEIPGGQRKKYNRYVSFCEEAVD